MERWMAVRPWENHFVAINPRNGVSVSKNRDMDDKIGTKPQLQSDNKKPFSSNIRPKLARQSTGPTLSNDCDSSRSNSAGLLESSNTQPVKANVEIHVEVAKAKPGIGSRSHSNPKERTSQVAKQAKKRLSLPNGEFVIFLCILFFPIHL